MRQKANRSVISSLSVSLCDVMNFQAEVNEQLNLSVPRGAKVHEGSLVAT